MINLCIFRALKAMIRFGLNTLIGLILSLMIATTASAQGDVIRQQGCDGNPYQALVDSLKQYYTLQGYSVLREASMTMESEYDMPIVLPMNAGTGYQFIFIGDPTSRLYEVRMFDYTEKQVVYKKNMWGDNDGNIISFSYVPQTSEYHMIKPLQVNKNKKKMCGYVMLLKRNQ